MMFHLAVALIITKKTSWLSALNSLRIDCCVLQADTYNLRAHW